MKLLILLALLISIASLSCSKTGANRLPFCVQQKINAIKLKPKWDPPAEVYEYEYKGKTIYVFSEDCCDQFSTAYDNDCKVVCAPWGGISGRGDGKCADFKDVAKLVRLVWKDPR